VSLRGTQGDKILDVPVADVVVRIKGLLTEIDTNLRTKAQAIHERKVKTCMSMQEAMAHLAAGGGFARVPFFSDTREGKDGDKIIHDKTGGEVRGFVPGEAIDANLTCVATGRPATVWAYVAKSY